jgi:hypothetical protein
MDFLWNYNTNSTSDSVLKISCNMQFEIISMNFSYSVTLKSIGLHWTLVTILLMHDFIILHIDITNGAFVE